MNRFEGKVVIVTGAGSGIGAETARRFLQEGACVVLNGRREYKLRETLTGFNEDKALVHAGDSQTRHTCGVWLRARLVDSGAWMS
jgi:meso-butanediol dehydrogenase/(S,S)-butanediol dehydrogenase/diacetyl reductase